MMELKLSLNTFEAITILPEVNNIARRSEEKSLLKVILQKEHWDRRHKMSTEKFFFQLLASVCNQNSNISGFIKTQIT